MDTDAFTALVEDHLPLIRRVVRVYAWEPADRADLEQEALCALWRSRERYDPTRRASTWIYRVCLNVAISWSRREGRRRGRQRELPTEAVWAAESDPVERAEELACLERCVAELGELDRALIVLSLDGNDHASIAEVLGISRSNVGTRLARVRERLRVAIEARRRENEEEAR